MNAGEAHQVLLQPPPVCLQSGDVLLELSQLLLTLLLQMNPLCSPLVKLNQPGQKDTLDTKLNRKEEEEAR